jgi:O-antigen/teichoic acid export membrane protein
LILGSFGAATGPFAAARRACLAILGIALAIASAASGPLAGAGAVGIAECRRRRNDAARLLAWYVVPTSLGLALTGSRWISLAFGGGFDVPAWLMIALAARIPAAVFGALSQTTAFALGEEKLVAKVAVAAVIAAVPAAGVGFAIAGATGASAALVLVEIGSWFVVESRLVVRGVAIDASSFPIEPAGGAAGLTIGCAATIGASAPAATIAGAAGFVTGAGFARLAALLRRPARPTCRVVAEGSRNGS